VSHIDAILTFAEALIARDSKQAFSTLHTISRSNTDLTTFAKDLSLTLRDVLIQKLAPDSADSGSDLSPLARDRIITLANRSNARELVLLTDLILRRMREIKTSPLPELPLELAITEWCEDSDAEVSPHSSESGARQDTSAGDPPLRADHPTAKKVERVDTSPDAPDESTPVKEGGSAAYIDQTTRKISRDESPLTEEVVREKWPEFLRRFAESSMSLMVILGATRIHSVSGNIIELVVPYSFHMDTLREVSCRKNMQDTMSTLLERSVTIHVSLCEEDTTTQPPVDPELANLASEFGGVVL